MTWRRLGEVIPDVFPDWSTNSHQRVEGVIKAFGSFAELVDVHHPHEPGRRVVGFSYVEGQANMAEALAVMSVCAKMIKEASK